MGRGGGIGGIVGIIVVFGLIWFLTGTNPLDMVTGTNTGPVSSSSHSRPLPQAGQDELADFVGVVVKETENLWTQVFQQNGRRYAPPSVVLFSDATQSGCGIAQAATGPFYCPNDKKVYIDLRFYEQLRRRFGAPGDFAQAYVIAHEIGHAVQDQTGVLPEFNARRARMSQEQQNAYSVRIELQADCYAGVWANYAGQENLLEQGDFEEAMNAANAIGDDTLTRGQVSERNFTHGTSEQRMRWFQRGYQTGDVGQCDTLRGSV
ncbi:MAG TPA: zinc metallopeptidase [Alphaproteobacteria bacterium]|nr:zinc metallopeptidase [Alphaproteobacteria bacterium]